MRRTICAGGRDIVFRPAVAADTTILGRFGSLLVSFHHELDPDRFLAATERTKASYAGWLEKQLVRQDVVMLVAEVDGAVSGYAYGTVEGPDYMALRGPAGVIHDLYVDQEHRRLGIGRSLLELMVGELEKRSAPRVILSAAARNEAARRLFAMAGFRETMVEMAREQ
ncbi:ribosomal protein S18 acetylase RimI-like enzyme [Rhizobium mesoamericanum]|uniref:GNAT family N-acetyltransferase n=1 Tax=Rhizobium mesoamericanum TaxID=1079800 RepID=UPI00277FAE95|nr:GNAT family N-acetyltransferase [Rhizobium mesoamericanum]MDQ0561572.1 ribosomal protein S18 acetylase RimI-like enzyme [Rhizobium mesoamericanum]